MTRAGDLSVHGANTSFSRHAFNFIQSIICSIPGHWHSSLYSLLLLQRQAYYAPYLDNVYASLRLLTFFQDKEYRALLTPPLLAL